MTKKLKIILPFINLFFGVYAQQMPQYSNYMYNKFLINPAVAGSEEDVFVSVNVRKQWAGFRDAPFTQTLSAHSYVGRYVGMGLQVYNDVASATRRSGIAFATDRQFKVNASNNTWLSLGMSAILYQYNFNFDKLNFDRPNDKVLEGSNNKITPDAAFGSYLYNQDYYVGLSIANIIQTRVDLIDPSYANFNQLKRIYFLNAGYKFTLNDNFEIEPSMLLKYTKAAPPQLDLNSMFTFAQNYWVGFSYRSGDALVGMLGFKFERFKLGYSYDFGISRFSKYNNGSHELTLILNTPTLLSKDNPERGGKKNRPKKYKKRKPSNYG